MEFNKFQIESFDPSKSTDGQLADDFRLLAAKYATMKDGGKTEFKDLPQVIEYTARLLKEIYQRGHIEFHPENQNKNTQELMRGALPRAVTEQIITEKASNLADGTFSLHLTTRKFDLTAPRLLAGKDGTIYGVIRFEPAKKISLVQFDETEAEHGYTEQDRKDKLGGKSDLFAYRVRDFYPFTAIKKRAEPYDEAYYAGLKPITKAFAIEFGEVAKRLEGSNVLEVGYGTGRGLEILNNSGYQASGIDNSEAAQKIATEKGLKNLYLGKAESLPFGDNFFDTVYSLHTLEHIGNIEKAISECLRVCKAKCLYIVPTGESADKTHRHLFRNVYSVKTAFKKVPFAKSFLTLDTGAVLVEIDKRIEDEFGIISKLDDFVVIPDYISLVGGYVNGDSFNDIDFVYRAEQPSMATELLMRNQFDKGTPLHAICNPLGPHGDHVPLYDLVAVRKKSHDIVKVQKADLDKAKFEPLARFTPPKTGGAYTLLEFFDIKDFLEQWARFYLDKKIPLDVETKYNGWRTVMEADDKKNTLVFFEDSKTDRSKQFPGVIDDLKAIDKSVILDGDFGGRDESGDRLARINLQMFSGNSVIENKFETPKGVKGSLDVTIFDIPFYGEDLRDLPLSERRKILEGLFAKYDFKTLKLGDYKTVNSENELVSAIKQASKKQGSEGAVVKATDGKYEFENIQSWAKLKNNLELKVQVTDVFSVKDSPDTFGYQLAYKDGGELKDLGRSFNTNVKANKGEIITVQVAEVIPKMEGGKIVISLNSPRVENTDPSRKEPEGAGEIIQRASNVGLLQSNPEIDKMLRAGKLLKADKPRVGDFDIKEGDEGEGVLQTHERGLSKDQVDYTEHFFGLVPVELTEGDIKNLKMLKAGKWEDSGWLGSEAMKKAVDAIKREDLTAAQRKALAKVDPVSIHTDFRLWRTGPAKDDYWQGGEGFTPGNQFKENLFLTIAAGDSKDRIMANFKLPRAGEGNAETEIRGPLVWLTIGEKEPAIFAPGEIGATENAFARVTVIDKFKWKAGVQRKDYKEFEFEGNNILKGRWIFTLSPLEIGSAWLIGRPAKQEFDSEALKKNWEISKKCSIFKIDDEKKLVYGAVYVPDEPDIQGDWSNASDLEDAAHQFFIDLVRYGGRKSGTNLLHETSDLGQAVQIVESATLPVDIQLRDQFLPKGTWFICAKINDVAIWRAIKSGDLNGFSMEGDAYGLQKK